MARFRNSNRIAAEEMTRAARKNRETSPVPGLEASYFRRIGFDFAMI